MKDDIKRVSKVLLKYRNNLLMETNSLDHVIECSLENYDFMIDFAINEGYDTVVDIGCAYGHQSEFCKDKIKYIGINEDNLKFYKEKEFHYLIGKYPFKIPKIKYFNNSLAISNLAIGWQCYVNEEEFNEQCKALKEDFAASLLYLPKEREEILKKNFEKVEIIKDYKEHLIPTAFYYCK